MNLLSLVQGGRYEAPNKDQIHYISDSVSEMYLLTTTYDSLFYD